MPRKVTIPMAFGRADRVDPKFAPFGALATAKNLRVRKDGRLASRNGYQPLTMTDINSNALVAFDLHEYSNGRLCAFGATHLEAHPTDVYEYRGAAFSAPWRPSDESGSYRHTLAPLTNPRQLGGASQPAGGVDMSDCAAGLGYVCVVYKPVNGTHCFVQITRESDDQVIFARSLASQAWVEARVCFAVDRFFFLGIDGTSGAIELGSFIPTTSTAVSVIATVVASGYTGPTGFLEINPVTRPGSSTVIVAYGLTSGGNVFVARYNTTGAQQGSTLTIAGFASPSSVDIEADETDNTVNVLAGTSAPLVTLRTYNFANALLDGPTSMTTGSRARMCRCPARADGHGTGAFNDHVAVAVEQSGGTITVIWYDQDTHVANYTENLFNAHLTSRMIACGSERNATGVLFGGFVEPATDDDSTNALWYLDSVITQMATRDSRASARRSRSSSNPLGLARDASTGRVAWLSLYESGEDIEQFTITTFDALSTARRQSASAGGLLYIAGAPVQVYDGHNTTESSFNEVPGIKAITEDGSGSQAQLGTYVYVQVWEYHMPDGTFFESPPSPPFEVTLTGANDRAIVDVISPHSERVALGDTGTASVGAEVTGVLYRTIWDSVNLSRGSQFHEVRRFSCPTEQSGYGVNFTINDGVSDANAAEMPVLYTQGGPVENNAPEMAAYLSSSSGRLLVSGLARQSEYQESKEQELDEGVNFNGLSAYFGRAPNPIVGAMSLDGVRLLFTRTDVYIVAGEGPDNAATGALPQPIRLASPGGLRDWRSLLDGPDGVWAQFDDAKLYRIPRGSGAPEWVAVDAQDVLAAYPTITGACRARADDAIAFACSNGDPGSDSRILVRSLRTGMWTEDTPPLTSSSGVRALCSFGDRLAYVSGGVVYAQNTGFTDGAASVITTEWQTHPIYPFELGGNGKMLDMQATGEFRSAGDLALRVSYDDGVSFTTYDTFTITGLTVGATVKRRWAIQQDDLQSAVFELVFTPSAPGEGFILNTITLLVEPSSGLEDLTADEMA